MRGDPQEELPLKTKQYSFLVLPLVSLETNPKKVKRLVGSCAVSNSFSTNGSEPIS